MLVGTVKSSLSIVEINEMLFWLLLKPPKAYNTLLSKTHKEAEHLSSVRSGNLDH